MGMSMKRRGKRGVPVGILNKAWKASLALAQKPKGVKGMGQGHVWRKNNPGKGIGLCKGPEVGGCLACVRNSEISVAGLE